MKKDTTNNICTPAWQEIAKQITDSREQVFKAAIFNLTKIAISCPKYRENIIELLQQSLCAKNTNQQRKAYLMIKIDEIKNRKP